MREQVTEGGNTRPDYNGMRERAERIARGSGRSAAEEIVDSTSSAVEELISGVEAHGKETRNKIEESGGRLDALLSGGTAKAIAREVKGESDRTEKKAKIVDDFVMPELDEIVGETDVAKDLEDEELRDVYEEAKHLDFTDALNTMNFGLEEQKKASVVTRAFIEEVRGTDLEELSRLASEQNQHMEQLNIGELKPTVVQRVLRKVLPGKQAEAVRAFLDKHSSLSDLVNQGEAAMAEERVKLETHHARMVKKIAENTEVYNQLGKRIGAAELSYAANKRYVEDVKKGYEDTSDAAKAREISLLDQALTRQARRMNSLKASRQETLQALRTMDMQIQGIEAQIAMIDEQAAFNRLVWDNSVLMVATDRRMKNSVEAVEFNRKKVEDMIKGRSGSIAQTLRSIQTEQGQGVVNAAVLEYAAHQLLRMNKAMIDGSHEIRQKMKDADAVISRMDRLVRDAAAHAAVMNDEDAKKLDDFIEQSGAGGDGAPAGPEADKKSKPMNKKGA